MAYKLLALVISTVALTLTGCGSGGGANSAPVFSQANYAISVNEDSVASLMVTASDAEHDAISFYLANAAANGAVTVNANNGHISYTPQANFNGTDSFQIAVSDGENLTTANVLVTVVAINDAPVIHGDTVLVSGGEIKRGKVTVTDVDNDTLSYRISVAAEHGTLLLDADNGELSYQSTRLENQADSFELTVTDGNGAVVSKRLTLTTNLSTNADRAYYYYASEQSHLKHAEQLAVGLQDDINLSSINASLAIGYAQAGLYNQVTRLTTIENIARNNIRANALLAIASVYSKQGKHEQANTLRLTAKNIYSEYVAAKGISAFNSEDQRFYNDLALSYLQAGESALASESFNILDVLFSAALGDEQTTQALKLFFGYRDRVAEVIESWRQSRSQADYDYALAMSDRLYRYANMIGYSYVKNNKHGNQGKAYFSSRQAALGNVVANYLTLNVPQKAKSALADIFALYGIVNLDPAYPRSANNYAAVTQVEYPYGLINSAGYFVQLYPELDIETHFLTAFAPESIHYTLAKNKASDAQLLAQVRNSADIEGSLQRVLASGDANNLRALFTQLVAFNARTPGAAAVYIELGKFDAAAKFIAAGIELLSSADYLAQNISNPVFVSGATGCQLALDQLLTIIDISQDEKYRSQAATTLQTCREIVLTHYQHADGVTVFPADIVDANIDLIAYHQALGQLDAAAPLINTAQQAIASYAEHALIQQINDTGKLASAVALNSQFALANHYYAQYIELIKQAEERVQPAERFAITQQFFASTRFAKVHYQQYLQQLLRVAGTKAEYSALIAVAKNNWAELIAWNLARLENAALQLQVRYYPAFAKQYLELAMFDSAYQLKNHPALGVVEADAIATEVIAYLSRYDAFIGSDVASVDTDNDGKANFYAAHASAAMIANSGIELDLDSDNDGVNDDSDAFPLNPNRH
ncbi:cadherin-like domain-containing protein [Pseudoalteromonas sp.]|uniref:cadherin-like domain-containing protein n=1 Tax=Pseudoalteromonas sp. TaxID=53249 RepID=UPI003565242D